MHGCDCGRRDETANSSRICAGLPGRLERAISGARSQLKIWHSSSAIHQARGMARLIRMPIDAARSSGNRSPC